MVAAATFVAALDVSLVSRSALTIQFNPIDAIPYAIERAHCGEAC